MILFYRRIFVIINYASLRTVILSNCLPKQLEHFKIFFNFQVSFFKVNNPCSHWVLENILPSSFLAINKHSCVLFNSITSSKWREFLSFFVDILATCKDSKLMSNIITRMRSILCIMRLQFTFSVTELACWNASYSIFHQVIYLILAFKPLLVKLYFI